MPVITIRGQMGSGAPEVGKMLATKMQIDYVDREIIAQVAKQIQWSSQGVAEKEMPPGTLLGRIAEVLGQGTPMIGGEFAGAYLPVAEIPLDNTSYLAGLEKVIKTLAMKDVIIRGRGSQFILNNFPGSLHVLLVASDVVRIKRVMEDLKLDEPEAKKEIARFDSSHREFVKRYFKGDLEDPLNYDVVLNTSGITFEDAVDILSVASKTKDKK